MRSRANILLVITWCTAIFAVSYLAVSLVDHVVLFVLLMYAIAVLVAIPLGRLLGRWVTRK